MHLGKPDYPERTHGDLARSQKGPSQPVDFNSRPFYCEVVALTTAPPFHHTNRPPKVTRASNILLSMGDAAVTN